MFLSPKETSEHLGVTPKTLRIWEKEGKIEYIKTNGNQYRYKIGDTKTDTRKKIIYARVSSGKQNQDLLSQVKYLKGKYPTHQCLTDIGSGLNFKRSNFRTVLEQLFKGDIQEVVVSYQDRWSRFGWDLFQWIFTLHGAKLVALQNKTKSKEQELSEDLMAIIHSFSSRGYGQRTYHDI